MTITPRIAAEICSHEGLVRQAYRDSVGVLTWGIGITSDSGHDVGRYVRNPQTLERCLDVFIWALGRYETDVLDVFQGHDLTEAQLGGALSFHWNTGKIRSASWPKLWKAGRIDEARASFLSWRIPEEVLPRRRKEAALFFDGTWSGDGWMTEYRSINADQTPDWGSAVRVFIRPTLEELLRPKPEVLDAQEKLDAIIPLLRQIAATLGID